MKFFYALTAAVLMSSQTALACYIDWKPAIAEAKKLYPDAFNFQSATNQDGWVGMNMSFILSFQESVSDKTTYVGVVTFNQTTCAMTKVSFFQPLESID